jgi:hypothetical protein
MNSTPVLVAPRPVRLTSEPASLFNRTHHLRHSQSSPLVRTLPLDAISERSEQATPGQAVVATTSPSMSPVPFSTLVSANMRQDMTQSPRLSPKEEVLEEFLSIFKSGAGASSSSPPPSSFLFSPSPTRLRALCSYRQQANNLFALEEIAATSSWNLHGRISTPSNDGSAFGHCHNRSEDEESGLVSGSILEIKPHNRWFSSSHLSSPISRTHTRNPFQRHPSYDLALLPANGAPRRPASACSRSSACASPVNIPLPPTPEVF